MTLFGSVRFTRTSPWLSLVVIVVVTLAASINRQIVGLIAQSVKTTLALTDAQIGSLFSFAGIFVAFISPFLGQMVDRFDRHRMLVCSIAIWSLATAAYGLSAGFFALGLSFAVLAGSETALVPLCNSIISDRFRNEARINANLVYFAAGGMTAGIGSYVGGLLLHGAGASLPHIVPFWPVASEWRVSLMATALIGVPLVAMVLLLGKDDRRRTKTAMTDLSDLRAYLKDHWQALVSFNLSNAGYYIAATTIMGWMPIYLVRRFGMTPGDLGMQLGAVIGVADVLGIIVGLAAIKKLYAKIGPMAPRYIFQFALCGIGLLCFVQLAATDVRAVLLALGVQNFLATFGTASFNNMVQDMSAPDVRGKIFGFNAFVVSIVSIPGPLLVGRLSDSMAGNPQGLLISMMMVSVPALVASVLLCGFTNGSFLRTVRAVRVLEYGEK